MSMFRIAIRLLGLGAIGALTLTAPAAIPMVAPSSAPQVGLNNTADMPVRLSNTPEERVVKALLLIKQGRLDQAEAIIDETLRLYPNFKLANLIKGDLLMAHTEALPHMGAYREASSEAIQNFEAEARVRLERHLDAPPAGRVPASLLQMSPQQKYALVVDTGRSRLYVFENHGGTPEYVTDYYITIGKLGVGKQREGDQRTPLGVYEVTDSLDLNKVGSFYGTGAFPLSYPNDWDKLQGKTGHGIWLHGVPADTYSRPPRASNGCVVLTNPDLLQLEPRLQFGVTPVIITSQIDWVTPAQREKLSGDLQAAVNGWEKDWESRDTGRYLSHYSAAFRTGDTDLKAWAAQKQSVNQGKSYIAIQLNNVAMFAYPGQPDMAEVTFEQDYKSNNLANRMLKRQYWKRENGVWKIIYEGSA